MVTALLSLSPSAVSCGTPLPAHPADSWNSTTSQCPQYIPSTCTVLREKSQSSPSQAGTPTLCALFPGHNPRALQHPSLPQCLGGIPRVPKAPHGSAGVHGTLGPVLPSAGSDPTHQRQLAPLFPSAVSPSQSPHGGCPGGDACLLPSVHQHKHLCGQRQLQQQSWVIWELVLRTPAVVSPPCCWAAPRALGHGGAAFNTQASSSSAPFSRERW